MNFLFAATTNCDPSGSFFGLEPWYGYLPKSDFQNCNIINFTFFPANGQSSDVPLILLAVVDDLLRIAALISIAFVITGAVRYITSQGNPEQTAKAQSTVINALIGLAIAIVAVTFVSFIGSSLKG